MMRRGHGEGEGHRGQGRRPDETRGGKASEGEEKGGTDRVDSCVCRGKRGGTKETDVLLGLRWGRPRERG